MRTGRIISVVILSILCTGIFAQDSDYFMSKKFPANYEAVIEDIRKAVKDHGFGVVHESQMHKSLMEKVPDLKMDPYIVLDVCNAKYAVRAIKSEGNIGVFLPCKILVKYISENSTEVVVIKPSVTMSVVKNKEIEKIAGEVTKILSGILESI